MRYVRNLVRINNIAKISCYKWNSESLQECLDAVSVESPLEICIVTNKSIDRKPISVTMRTPGSDAELALGFLFGEGMFSSMEPTELMNLKIDTNPSENRVVIHVPDSIEIDEEYFTRNFYTTSSCGVCGKSSINALLLAAPPLMNSPDLEITPNIINSLPEQMRETQVDFNVTGGTHASAIFDKDGFLMYFAEDVGRHNAMDKVIGTALLNGNLDNAHMVCFSGRTSFELIQKSAMAGIRVVVCIGAPSSLAVELANTFDMILIGFHRGSEFNVYSGHDDIFFTKD